MDEKADYGFKYLDCYPLVDSNNESKIEFQNENMVVIGEVGSHHACKQ